MTALNGYIFHEDNARKTIFTFSLLVTFLFTFQLLMSSVCQIWSFYGSQLSRKS